MEFPANEGCSASARPWLRRLRTPVLPRPASPHQEPRVDCKKLAVFSAFWHLTTKAEPAARRPRSPMRASSRIPGLMSRPIVALVLATSGLAGGIAACSESKSEPVPSHPTKATAAPPTSANSSAVPANANGTVESRKSDAGNGAQPTAAAPEPVTYDGPLIGALFGQTPIMSDMAWPKKDEDRDKDKKDKGAVRIGYIRQGQKVPVLPEPHPKSNCKDGWYELVQGGFVCGRYASLDLNHPKDQVRPPSAGPRVTASLPVRLQRLQRHAALPHDSVAGGAPQARAVARSEAEEGEAGRAVGGGERRVLRRRPRTPAFRSRSRRRRTRSPRPRPTRSGSGPTRSRTRPRGTSASTTAESPRSRSTSSGAKARWLAGW